MYVCKNMPSHTYTCIPMYTCLPTGVYTPFMGTNLQTEPYLKTSLVENIRHSRPIPLYSNNSKASCRISHYPPPPLQPIFSVAQEAAVAGGAQAVGGSSPHVCTAALRVQHQILGWDFGGGLGRGRKGGLGVSIYLIYNHIYLTHAGEPHPALPPVLLLLTPAVKFTGGGGSLGERGRRF